MKKLLLLLSLLVVGVATAACGGQTPETGVPVTVIVNAEEPDGYPTYEDCLDPGYPAPDQSGDYPYPPEVESEEPFSDLPECNPTPVPVPPPSLTVTPGTGSVVGFLYLNGEPVSAAILYASPLIDGLNGAQAVRFNRRDQNRAFTAQDGSFKIINLELGMYGLVLDTIQQAYLLDFPDGETVLVDIVGVSQVDLGVLDYDQLPSRP
jgi:hypothetical protein